MKPSDFVGRLNTPKEYSYNHPSEHQTITSGKCHLVYNPHGNYYMLYVEGHGWLRRHTAEDRTYDSMMKAFMAAIAWVEGGDVHA